METPTIKKISVIGPGMMGHAIAQEFAAAGYEVMLCGRSEDRLQEAMAKIERSLVELAEWEIISENDVAPSLESIQTTTDLTTAGSFADLIVEAIIEELEIKNELFSKLDTIASDRTIFASNTSSILPSVLAAATRRPDRFLVIHYFNPPYLMPLVEIVRGNETSDATVEVSYNLMKSIGKSPIV